MRPAADLTDSNYRDYSDEPLATLTFVRRARELGFSMAPVRELLALSDHDDNPCTNVDNLVEVQLGEIDRIIADLTGLRDQLNRMLRSCRGERICNGRSVGARGRWV